MVLIDSEQQLLMMRPYQIYAAKVIVDCIGQNCGNGYIWHTTGSDKTLTSFKASTLLKINERIPNCLFVVDRKDLDRQTREEFNHFALLTGIVRDHDGAVVKTVGDAVMASFGDPAQAVQAALAIQAAIADHDLALNLGVCRPQRGRDAERPARLFRLDREHGRPPAGARAAAATSCCRARWPAIRRCSRCWRESRSAASR